MAGPTDSDDVQATSSDSNTDKPSNPEHTTENVEDVTTNGTVSCSSFAGSKGGSILRPSLFSSSTGSTSSTSVFGSSASSSFGSSSRFGSSPHKSHFSLRPSIFGSNKDAANKRPVVLRPSQLEPQANSPVSSTTSNSNSSFILSPAKLSNPCSKEEKNVEDSSNNSVTSTSLEKSMHLHQESDNTTSSNCSSEAHKVSFVPLASSVGGSNQSYSQSPAPASNTVPSFVFGQNLLERVEMPNEALRSDGESNDAVSNDASTCHGDASKTNGASPEMLFSSVIQRELPEKQTDMGSDERKRKSLSEAAREYEESRASKKKYEEVAVKTGEEEEINILQINCKLFAFNKEKSTWVERGRGTLRLNDQSTDNRTQSRVVMRVSGSLRVVLNTKIWAEMSVDKPSEKSVRFSAMDSNGDIKLFLVMAGIKETDQLFKALEWRVNNQKKMASACEKSSETNDS